MKKLRGSLLLKAVAVVLVVASLGVGIASGVGAGMLMEVDYRRENLTYYDTHWSESWSNYYAYQVIEWYEAGVGQREMDSWFAEADTNFAFRLLDTNGAVLLKNYIPAQAGAQGSLQTGGYTVEWWVKAPIAASDYYYGSYQMFNTVYPIRRSLPVFLVLSALVFFAGLIYLFAAAGWRKGAEGPSLNMMDKIPLDIYLGGGALLAGCLVYFALDNFQLDSPWELAVIAVFLGAAFLVGLACLLSLATRVKVGKWWRNSVTWMVGSWCTGVVKRLWRGFWGILGGIARGLPLIWKAALGFLAATGLNLFFCAVMFNSYNQGTGFFFFFLFNFVLFCAFCYLAMNLQKLRRAGRRLAAGDLEYKVDLKMMFRDFKEHGENLNRIGEGMSAAVDQRMRSERLKTELITNVSHDIKTPLTSIINYVDLLGQEPLDGRAAEYLAVLDRQSKRLKKLTEDLVEASKASTGNLQVNLEPTGVCETVRQALGEYDERLEAGGLEAVLTLPEGEITAMADGRLLWRVIDNLLSNACKYSLPGTRVYVDVALGEREAVLAVKNISRQQLNIPAQELMERFVRGDSSRSTEGSGLGLNIAKSLVDLMQGGFGLAVDGDLFKAEVRLPLAQWAG